MIGNFIVTCHVFDEPCNRYGVYAGAQVISLDADLDIHTNRLGPFSYSDLNASSERKTGSN